MATDALVRNPQQKNRVNSLIAAEAGGSHQPLCHSREVPLENQPLGTYPNAEDHVLWPLLILESGAKHNWDLSRISSDATSSRPLADDFGMSDFDTPPLPVVPRLVR